MLRVITKGIKVSAMHSLKNMHGAKLLNNRIGNLTFRGPCIVIYAYMYNKNQRDALISQIPT